MTTYPEHVDTRKAYKDEGDDYDRRGRGHVRQGRRNLILRRIAYPRWPFDSTDPEDTVRTGSTFAAI